MSANTCNHCGQSVATNLFQCPHCGQQIGFPNVTAADTPEETVALNARLTAALDALKARGAESKGQEFAALLESADAVINRYFGELYRLAWSDDQIYATYYQKVQAGLQVPETDRWNRLRGIADTILFGDANKPHVRFAAFSLDGAGLDSYGDCSMKLTRTMIEHRSSVFEENSLIFMKHHRINGVDDYEVPPGYRATWVRRVDLCMAKLGRLIQPNTSPSEFVRILLCPGTKPEEDEFLEVHIWGPLTIRSFERVLVKKWAIAPSIAEKRSIKARLDKVGVRFEAP